MEIPRLLQQHNQVDAIFEWCTVRPQESNVIVFFSISCKTNAIMRKSNVVFSVIFATVMNSFNTETEIIFFFFFILTAHEYINTHHSSFNGIQMRYIDTPLYIIT